ncbi:MAG: RsmE family RNA methyltransferase [Chitinophagaceae bacterium]
MNLPCFYAESISVENECIVLDEDNSRHLVQVLRLKKGEQVQLTDGQGNLLTTSLVADQKKSAQVRVLSTEKCPPPAPRTAIGISLIKNTSRFEWFLEKAAEIGVNEIIPLICERTEKQHFRIDRMRNILISAMLQSRQVWLAQLHDPIRFSDVLTRFTLPQRFIAHCLDGERHSLSKLADAHRDNLVLIGPEGDFTQKEIEQALINRYTPVLLGKTRLRTETAGIVAATLLKSAY